MITLEQYVGHYADHPDWTPEHRANAARLLSACGQMENIARASGVVFLDSPKTDNGVSGEHDGNGGFRPKDCPVGAEHSSHKEGLAVDRYDPHGWIDDWCMMNSEEGGLMEQCGIYIEHPIKTQGWSHWTIKPPGSGKRVFMP
jgi:hypothetical protein